MGFQLERVCVRFPSAASLFLGSKKRFLGSFRLQYTHIIGVRFFFCKWTLSVGGFGHIHPLLACLSDFTLRLKATFVPLALRSLHKEYNKYIIHTLQVVFIDSSLALTIIWVRTNFMRCTCFIRKKHVTYQQKLEIAISFFYGIKIKANFFVADLWLKLSAS